MGRSMSLGTTAATATQRSTSAVGADPLGTGLGLSLRQGAAYPTTAVPQPKPPSPSARTGFSTSLGRTRATANPRSTSADGMDPGGKRSARAQPRSAASLTAAEAPMSRLWPFIQPAASLGSPGATSVPATPRSTFAAGMGTIGYRSTRSRPKVAASPTTAAIRSVLRWRSPPAALRLWPGTIKAPPTVRYTCGL